MLLLTATFRFPVSFVDYVDHSSQVEYVKVDVRRPPAKVYEDLG